MPLFENEAPEGTQDYDQNYQDYDDYHEEPELIFPTNDEEKRFYFFEQIKKLAHFIKNQENKINPPKLQFKNDLEIINRGYKKRFIDKTEPIPFCETRKNKRLEKMREELECNFWTKWSREGSCSVTCGDGKQIFTRTCENRNESPIKVDPEFCTGENQKTSYCNLGDCPMWENWSSWSSCSADCADYLNPAEKTEKTPFKTRTRKLENSDEIQTDKISCNAFQCPFEYGVSDQHCEGNGIGCHQVTTQYCQQKSPSGQILNDVRKVKASEKEFFKCRYGPTSRSKEWWSPNCGPCCRLKMHDEIACKFLGYLKSV